MARIVPYGDFEPGAVARLDGTVVQAALFVHEDGIVTFASPEGGGTRGQMKPGLEGVCWARGAWDSEPVVALRSLAALDKPC